MAERDLRKILAQRVLEARKRAGLTQAALAEAAGLTDETVSRLERGAFEPSVSTLCALATALNVGTDYLVGMSARDQAREPRTSPHAHRLVALADAMSPAALRALLKLAVLLPARERQKR